MDDLLTIFFTKAAPYPNTFIVFIIKEPIATLSNITHVYETNINKKPK